MNKLTFKCNKFLFGIVDKIVIWGLDVERRLSKNLAAKMPKAATHVCTKFEEHAPVRMNGQLLPARQCVECGRIITRAGVYSSPEKVEKMGIFLDALCMGIVPEDGEEAKKHLQAILDHARKINGETSKAIKLNQTGRK